MADVQKLLIDRADDGRRRTNRAAIQCESVASVLCIIVSEPILLPRTSTPAQHERSGGRSGLTMTRKRLEHLEGQSLLLAQPKLSLGADSWTRGE